MSSPPTRQFIHYPPAVATDQPFSAPPPGTNPVVRGLLLRYGASLITSVGAIQQFLYNSNGFSRLQEVKGLDAVECRFDPTVIPAAQDASATVETGTYTRPSEFGAVEADAGAGRYYSVLDFHKAYTEGRFTPTDVAEALLPLIRRDVEEPTSHSVAWMDTKVELVRKAAEEATKRYQAGTPIGILDGVPVAVKDEVDLKGYTRCLGTKDDHTHPLDATSYCVTKWEEEGAVVVGKLSMHEIGLDTTNNNPNHGTPHNPHNPDFYTGGSSGGSAYAVGAGLIPIALGADGGGSIRIPSSFCGIYGLKTSHSRVSIRPTASLAISNSVAGPMAANMVDLEVAYRVMAIPDPSHSLSSTFLPPARPHDPPRKLLGIYKPWFDRAEPAVRDVCQAALNHMTSQQGYSLVDISIPFLVEGGQAHAITILSEIASGFPSARATNLTPANRVLLAVAGRARAQDLLAAQRVRNALMQHLAHLYRAHPGLIIVTPTTPLAGWAIGDGDLSDGVSDGDRSIRNMEYVWLANFTGCPALSMPVGYVAPGTGQGDIPVGLMGMGEWGAEEELIRWGFDGEGWLREGWEGGRQRAGAWVDVVGLAEEKGERS
ncbi:amidase signature enzyme [Eremomyces bilateralis CBS 781.70]|uniref:Amidase signature enzyme n=1 Tax=Eremomyces bilateralis CBS 781.70 TaxID=1392243 RepID=A0A6G1G7M8_9PEZI|nr:amidase signature enzyme [Eremomyces bilateralis CBS 781.70]KAF1814077.1 amidase signature enzyme [Eremomyces bilateralis CBS 781.70]